MSKKKDGSPLEGFSGLVGGIMPEQHDSEGAVDLTSNDNKEEDPDDVVDLSLGQKDKDSEDKANSVNNSDDKTDDKTDDKLIFKDEDVPDKEKEVEEKDKTDGIDDKSNDDESDDDDNQGTGDESGDDEAESAGVGQFFDAFSEALGWDVKEDEKPTTVDGLIDYIKQVVDENSEPEYSDDRVKELDDFVKNGGNFEDFYKQQTSEIDYDNIDLEDENNQKKVIKDYLQKSGFSEEQINRKINRFEEAGMLEDEAKDNADLMKEYIKNEKEQMAEQQRQQQEEYENRQKELITNITDNINNLTEVRGINVPAEDRKKLLDYAFKTDANGQTQFQKDYAKNATKSFIETAYFSMKGDALLNSAKHSGESSAINKLKQTLKTSTKRNRSTNEMNNSSARPVWTAASTLFGSR